MIIFNFINKNKEKILTIFYIYKYIYFIIYI